RRRHTRFSRDWSSDVCSSDLAKLIQSISDVSVDILINGGRFSKVFQLVRPITLHSKLFDDFDAIAFCPQALNSHDDLYDPMMGEIGRASCRERVEQSVVR